MQFQIAGDIERAAPIYEDILRSDPDNADANHLLGLVLSEQDQSEAAISLIEKALLLNPDAAPFHHNIAGIYRRVGRLSEAKARFQRAIELKADYGEAYQGLAEMIRFERGDPFIARVADQLRSELPTATRSYMHFAAGKYFDDIGEYQTAFEHYKAGNAAAVKPFDRGQFTAQVKNTLYAFSGSHVAANRDAGDASEQPVFIVGMPRSGSTLIEQILSSHSGVYGAGELNEMKLVAKLAGEISRHKSPYPECVSGLAGSAYRRLAADYSQRVRALVPDGFAAVVDKHPLNFQFLGLIFLMFPNAKVIHTVRHPLDTCLSCFFQNFTRGQNYTFDLMNLAHFYVDYQRLMEHWQMLFPDRILTVSYEQMLSDQEGQTTRLLDYCGLSFEAACLDFHKTERTVKTASFMQVRQPIYNTSMNRWRHYAPQLQEIAGVLNIPIELPVTITGNSPIFAPRR